MGLREGTGPRPRGTHRASENNPTYDWVARDSDAAGTTGPPSTVGPVVPGGQEVEAVLERPAPRGIVSGVILGPSGAPEPRMGVSPFDEMEVRWAGTFADDEGRFTLEMPLGRSFALVVDGQRRSTRAEMKEMKERYGQLVIPPRTGLRGRFDGVTAPATGIAIRLHEAERDRSLAVRVLDLDGKPVAGMKVLVIGAAGRREGVTDADGRTRFDGLEAVEVEVLVLADRPGALPAGSLVPEPARAVPGEAEVVLRCRAGVPVDGVVFDPEGNPRPGTRVWLAHATVQPGMPLGETATTDDRGRFRLTGLDGVPQRIVATWFDGQVKAYSGDATVTPPRGDVEVRIAAVPR